VSNRNVGLARHRVGGTVLVDQNLRDSAAEKEIKSKTSQHVVCKETYLRLPAAVLHPAAAPANTCARLRRSAGPGDLHGPPCA
jgi:hypothetical protein